MAVILATRRVDFLLVIPADFTTYKPRGSLVKNLVEMLELTYGDGTQVVIGDAYEFGFPQSRGIISFLRQFTAAKDIVGIASHDDLKGKPINENVTAFLVPADRWLLLGSEAYAKEAVPSKIGGKPVDFEVVDKPLSSV